MLGCFVVINIVVIINIAIANIINFTVTLTDLVNDLINLRRQLYT